MPVTARLSRKFYEKLGDELANELVEWFNMVDATYRGDLRDLNELNFARFDAKLEQRVEGLQAKLEAKIAGLQARFEQRLAEMETRLTRRLFNFWIAQAATTAALVFAVVKLVH